MYATTSMRIAGGLLTGILAFSGSGQAAQNGELTSEVREQRLQAARERLEQAAREVAELSLDESGRREFFSLRNLGFGRAALGINIARADAQRGEDSPDEGVPVISVSPGGPAAEAGIQAGDVILSIDGTPLRRENGRSSQAALLAFMDGVEPGQTVAVEYRRGSQTNSAQVVAQRLGPEFLAGTRVMPMLERVLPPERTLAFFRGSNVFGAIELVSLTPKLGQYFGADQGLLVVRAPADSRLGLEEGDVLLDIAGRVPTSPAHAMRILESYQPGEKLVLNVLRQRKKLPLNIEVPSDTRRGGVRLEQFQTPAIPAIPVIPGPGRVIINEVQDGRDVRT